MWGARKIIRIAFPELSWYNAFMGTKERKIQWIYSDMNNIEEHIVKFEQAYKKGDYHLAEYYKTEIVDKFRGNIQKRVKQIDINRKIQEDVLATKRAIDEIQDLPLN